MDDHPEPPDVIALPAGPVAGSGVAGAGLRLVETAAEGRDLGTETIPVLEETATVAKRRVATGRTRVSTHTETYEQMTEVELDRNEVEVTRVPVGRVVDRLPPVRTEGGTTVIPVVEERLVVVKQLFLKEELHVRQEVKRDAVRQPVELRRQRVVIERVDAEGRPVDPDKPQASPAAGTDPARG